MARKVKSGNKPDPKGWEKFDLISKFNDRLDTTIGEKWANATIIILAVVAYGFLLSVSFIEKDWFNFLTFTTIVLFMVTYIIGCREGYFDDVGDTTIEV
jgi:hypothetical protein